MCDPNGIPDVYKRQELARQYSQLWEIFCRALEQCAALLGEVEAAFADFSRLLRLLLSLSLIHI